MQLETKTKIVLVEDNDLDVIIVQRLMRKMNLNLPIIRAKNGEEALALLRPEHDQEAVVPPFIMIIDINMPRMNGFELLEQLADDPTLSDVPIYLMSTSNRDSDKDRARQYRIRGYLVKPVTEPVLLDILDKQNAA